MADLQRGLLVRSIASAGPLACHTAAQTRSCSDRMRVGRCTAPWDIPGVDSAAGIRLRGSLATARPPHTLAVSVWDTPREFALCSGPVRRESCVRATIGPNRARPSDAQETPMASPSTGIAGRTRSTRRDDGYARPIAGALNLAADHIDAINRSHERCAALGLSRIERPDLGLLGRADLEIARSRNLRLLQHAAPVMELLYDQIVNTDSMVVLTDATGTIVHAMGDDDFLTRATKVALFARRGVVGVEQGHQRGGHRADHRAAHARARRRALLPRQPLPHLLGGADPRPARQHPRRARRLGRPAQLPPAHDGAGQDVGAHDREPLAHRRPAQRDAAALPRPRRFHRHADGGHRRGAARWRASSAPTAARWSNWA